MTTHPWRQILPTPRACSARPARCLGAALSLLLVFCQPSQAQDGAVTAAEIVSRAHAAAGGETWRNVKTLQLVGNATFYRDGVQANAASADNYRMWRVLPEQSEDAHRANGMVRFDARNGAQTVFQISFDGEHSYNQAGRIADEAASEQWKSNFGFGIIRFALEPDFTLSRLADDTVDGHPCHFVSVTDPAGRQTLFAVDRASFAIRLVGFDTPRGYHHRVYDGFYRKTDQAFTQPGHVRLYYDGVKTADIQWTDYSINAPLARQHFVLD